MKIIEIKISKQDKDIISKYTSNLFRDTSLEFYGIKSAKIKDLINVELQSVEVTDTSMDIVFLLEDNTYMHLEFQSQYRKSDLLRFAMYDLQLNKRDDKTVETVIIYSSDVNKISENLEIGSLKYHPTNILMNKYDGSKIYSDLEVKLNLRQELTDTDMLNLIFLPLMKWSGEKISRRELAEKSVKMAQTIPDREKRIACIASTVSFTHKYLTEADLNQILEVIRVTDLGAILIKEGFEQGSIQGFERGTIQGAKQDKIKTAKKMLRKNESIEKIIDYTELTEDEINDIKEML